MDTIILFISSSTMYKMHQFSISHAPLWNTENLSLAKSQNFQVMIAANTSNLTMDKE